MDPVADELKKHPSIERVEEILKGLIESDEIQRPSTASLSIYSTLVNETLPAIHNDLDKKLVSNVFSTLPGLSSLLARIQSLCDSVSSEGKAYEYQKSIAIYSHINLLASIVGSTISNSTVAQVWTQTGSRIEQREVSNLFVGSRILACLSNARFILDQVAISMSVSESSRYDSWEWVSGESYIQHIAPQVCQAGNVEMFERLWKLGFPDAVAKTLVTRDHYDQSVSLILQMRKSEIERCIVSILKFLQPSLTDPQEQSVSATAAILNKLVEKLDFKSRLRILEHSIKANLGVRRVTALLCHELDVFNWVVTQWGDSVGIKHNALALQESQTQILILTMAQLTSKQISEASHEPAYLNAISNRLASPSDRARIFGTTVAEIVSKRAGDTANPLVFDLQILESEQAYWKDIIAQIKDKTIDYTDAVWDMIGTKSASGSTTKTKHALSRTPTGNKGPSRGAKKQAKVEELDSDDEDGLVAYPMPRPEDDPEDSDDDDAEPKPHKERARVPVYIRDLITYWSSEDYEKQKLALEHAPELIRRKAQFGQELHHSAKPLADIIAGSRDQFNIDGFETMRLHALTALVASSPTVVPPYLAEMLFIGDYSIQQRMVILSSISLGARELAGLAEESSSDQKFASKRLPGRLDDLFSIPEVDSVTVAIQRKAIESTANQANDIIGGPKVLRVSRKLQKEREHSGSSGTRSTYNQYAKLAARYFVSPLTAQWSQVGVARTVGNYSEILSGHFFKTLALLLHAAYPSSNDIPDITSELLDIVLQQRSSTEVVVLEGLLTIVLVVLEVNEGEFLVTTWSRKIVEIKSWLEGMWETIIDENVRALAAGLIIQLEELTEKWQRRLIGQLAGIEMDHNIRGLQ